jgi:hypothetical protein
MRPARESFKAGEVEALAADVAGSEVEGLDADCVHEEAVDFYWSVGLACGFGGGGGGGGGAGVGVGYVSGWAEVVELFFRPDAGVVGVFGSEEEVSLELWA